MSHCSDPSKCHCQTTDADLDRREFLRGAGTGAVALTTMGGTLPIMAGPFDESEYLEIIPSDKKLDPAWIRALYERGEKEVYSDTQALQHIGMPVGGLFAGTVYLGGDGRLWLWDIFNRDQNGIAPRQIRYKNRTIRPQQGANYVEPVKPYSPFKQEFGLRVRQNGKEREIPLNQDGCKNIIFQGEYPRALVTYRDLPSALSVTLEAFSPFVPLNADDSSLPATIMHYTVKNTGSKPVEATLYGYLQNPICHETRDQVSGRLQNHALHTNKIAALVCGAETVRNETPPPPRPDIVFETFEKPVYEGWTVEGEAFGDGPIATKDIPNYQGNVRGQGKRVVNSHASAPAQDMAARDAKTGKLTSKPFTIERKYIKFLIGGGAHKEQTCLNLLIDGKIMNSATGRSENQMDYAVFNVSKFEGKQARLEIVDQHAGSWGNIGVDHIVFTDQPVNEGKLEDQRDFGTMALMLLDCQEADKVIAMKSADSQADEVATGTLDDELTGEVSRRLIVPPGGEQSVTFVISWHFPNFYGRGLNNQRVGHFYATRFTSALQVGQYIAQHFDRLAGDTRQWVKTWYDSTLPYWLLDRTMANTSILATTTCYRFADGRFWAWEGVGCCGGTCTHVWHYAQAPGRLFPEIERDRRERVDFGSGLHADGGIAFRVSLNQMNHPAHDGQCGRILGAYREHQTSTDDAFLKRNWPAIKKAIAYLIKLDENGDGMIEGAQPNTLDAAWYGKISFLASLYLAALRAGEAMAVEMGDVHFSRQCKTLAERGAESILELYNDEYFVQIEDPAKQDAIGVGSGCYIDQVFGQSWAHQVGLGRLFDQEKQRSALRALWKYNFVPDVGPFRDRFKRGRWYATAGDAGLLMCTWPRGGQNPNFKKHWQSQYFNECMTGFEWQVAAHMVAEGKERPDLLEKGLAVSRAIHDRYNAALRNPYNEIECSDHYSRAMASYGVFITACGFEYHGPKGHLAFVPRLSPENFRAPFTASEGWGTFTQWKQANGLEALLEVKWGRLRLNTLTLAFDGGVRNVTVNGKNTAFQQKGDRVEILLSEKMLVNSNETVKIKLNSANEM